MQKNQFPVKFSIPTQEKEGNMARAVAMTMTISGCPAHLIPDAENCCWNHIVNSSIRVPRQSIITGHVPTSLMQSGIVIWIQLVNADDELPADFVDTFRGVFKLLVEKIQLLTDAHVTVRWQLHGNEWHLPESVI